MSFTRYKRGFSNQAGQTMVDLVVALALISGSVASAGVLATSSNRVAMDSSHRTEAIGLAEREMEGLRSYRDTFERAGVDWSTTPLGVTPGCSYFVMKLAGTDWVPVTVGNTQTDYAAQDGGDATLAAKYNGFSRLISACPAKDYQQTDYTAQNPTGPLNATNSSKIRTVTITVNWLEGNQTKTLVERSMMGDYGQ